MSTSDSEGATITVRNRPTATPSTEMATKDVDKSIPKLDNRLSGQLNYAGWILTIEQYLSMHDIDDEYTYWDLVIGGCTKPGGEASTASKQTKD